MRDHPSKENQREIGRNDYLVIEVQNVCNHFEQVEYFAHAPRIRGTKDIG